MEHLVGQHYNDVIMSAIASQIASLTTVYLTVYSDANQRKYQSSASLAFVWSIHRGPVTRKMFPFDDVIMISCHTHKADIDGNIKAMLSEHDERDGISVCSTVYSVADKKTSRLLVTGLCKGNPQVTGGFPSNVTRSRRHHALPVFLHGRGHALGIVTVWPAAPFTNIV